MPIIIIAAMAAIFLAMTAVFSGVGNIKKNAEALEHSARELLIRLQAMEGQLDKIETATQEGMSAFREELRSSQRSLREEILNLIKR